MIKRFFILLFISAVVFSSCQKEDDNNLSTQDSKTTLTQANSDISADVSDLMNSDGAKSFTALSNIISINDPFSSAKKSVKISTRHFSYLSKLFFIPKIERKSGELGSGEKFDFDSKVGTYTWNIEYQNWDIQHGTPSNQIIINFPTDSSSVNNAVLTINSYTEQEFSDDNDTWYQPTQINANIYVGQEKHVDIDFTAAYNTLGDPTSVNANVFLKPFTLTVNSEKGNNKITVSVTLKKSDNTIVDINLTVNFSDANYETASKLDGYVQIGHLKLQGSIDVEALQNTTDVQSIDQLNKNVKLSLYTDTGKKIGDLAFIEGLNGDIDLQIVFNDGTTELASDYFKGLIETFKSFFNKGNMI